MNLNKNGMEKRWRYAREAREREGDKWKGGEREKERERERGNEKDAVYSRGGRTGRRLRRAEFLLA